MSTRTAKKIRANLDRMEVLLGELATMKVKMNAAIAEGRSDEAVKPETLARLRAIRRLLNELNARNKVLARR